MSSLAKRKRMETETTDRQKRLKEDCEPDSVNCSVEILSAQTIREGMVILGCVTEVKKTCLLISLPGCLKGVVPLTNISDEYTESLKRISENSEHKEIPVSSFIQPGMVFPCQVLQVVNKTGRKPAFELSIKPNDVNKQLAPSSLYEKMVLYGSVSSIEDHGYIVNVGNFRINAFLSKEQCKKKGRELYVGEVIPTYIRKISTTSEFVHLCLLDFDEEFPEIKDENIRLDQILPGARIRSDVIEVQHPFVFTKFSAFDACASMLSFDYPYRISIGSTVIGTVLYVHPITHVIYFMLNTKPCPGLYPRYFGLVKYENVENLQFRGFYKNCAYYKIKRGAFGFIYTRELPKSSTNESPTTVQHAVSKACVISFHYMDRLVQMTLNPSLLEKNIILEEDIQIGQVYEGLVKSHVYTGMFIQICPGVCGLVRNIQMSDVITTKPEITFPVDSVVKCRVLSVTGQLNFTCKKSLVELPSQDVLLSYEQAQKGHFYKGVIVKKSETFILVLFFNDVKGISPTEYVPERAYFYEGQVVLCEVVKCNPKTQKLVISLKTAGQSLVQDFSDVSPDVRCSDEMSPVLSRFNSQVVEKRKAKIIKKQKNQLNIEFGKQRGRVHITEVGCSSENIYPLEEFSVGKEIDVFMFSEYEVRKRNFSAITHRNKISYKECTLIWPPFSSSVDLKPSDAVIGFVKEVHAVSMVLWLTPTLTGVLDFLHFSEDLKAVRNLREKLKLGLSVKATVLDCYENGDGNRSFTLTKIDANVPEVGKNILAFVQVACLEKGLILKLPFGYSGNVALTDLADVYISSQEMLDKFSKLKFLKGCVLEVNHQTKWCQLSLRKSKVYEQKIVRNDMCPEVTEDCIKEGMVIKGFVVSVTNSSITVELGRRLEGKVKFHSCQTPNCGICSFNTGTYSKYLIGSIVKVAVKDISADGISLVMVTSPMDFPVNEINDEHSRLILTDPLPWEETMNEIMGRT